MKNIDKNIINLLFEAKMLKEIPRTGFHYLGSGKESIAEHSFLITFIAFIISKIEPDIDALKIISMCLIHDLPEARMGDLNYVHKIYSKADEKKAITDLSETISFGEDFIEFIEEFNNGSSKEAMYARDADQLSIMLELKALKDQGFRGPEQWLVGIEKRLKTDLCKNIAKQIFDTNWDDWWHNIIKKNN